MTEEKNSYPNSPSEFNSKEVVIRIDHKISDTFSTQPNENQTIRWLKEFYSSWKFHIYYIVTTILALIVVIYCIFSNCYIFEVLVGFLLYILLSLEITGKLPIISGNDLCSSIYQLIEITG